MVMWIIFVSEFLVAFMWSLLDIFDGCNETEGRFKRLFILFLSIWAWFWKSIMPFYSPMLVLMWFMCFAISYKWSNYIPCIAKLLPFIFSTYIICMNYRHLMFVMRAVRHNALQFHKRGFKWCNSSLTMVSQWT